jgi:hypothetical protein
MCYSVATPFHVDIATLTKETIPIDVTRMNCYHRPGCTKDKSTSSPTVAFLFYTHLSSLSKLEHWHRTVCEHLIA